MFQSLLEILIFAYPKLCPTVSSKFYQPLLGPDFDLKFDGRNQKNVMTGRKQEGSKACLRDGELER